VRTALIVVRKSQADAFHKINQLPVVAIKVFVVRISLGSRLLCKKIPLLKVFGNLIWRQIWNYTTQHFGIALPFSLSGI